MATLKQHPNNVNNWSLKRKEKEWDGAVSEDIMV